MANGEVAQHDVVLEVLDGCAHFAAAEAERLGAVQTVGPTELALSTSRLAEARELRRVVAAYLRLAVPARRPREILETSSMRRLADAAEHVRTLKPRGAPFHGLRLAAAGSDTPVMRRLADELAERVGLPVDPEDGDLLMRVRPARTDQGRPRDAAPTSWEVLLRLTPRPLSTRAWRTTDYPGAVNATIAASVLDLMGIGPRDTLLDMTCGSGTFLVEQSFVAAPVRCVGVDIDPLAIGIARTHQRAARRRGRIDWRVGDIRTLELEGGFSRVIANPPWGELHGEHASNEKLLVDLLERAAELASPHARLGILTHEIRRMHDVARREGLPWVLQDEHRFFQKGHHPRLFRFERAGGEATPVRSLADRAEAP